MANKRLQVFCREAEDGTETEVIVEFTQTPIVPARTYGRPEDCYPAEGGEVEIQRAFTEAEGWEAKYTEAEEEKWIDWLVENPDSFDDGEPDF